MTRELRWGIYHTALHYKLGGLGIPRTYLYVASPYTKYPLGINCAFSEVTAAMAELVKAGVAVFSPITHTHPIADIGKLDPLDHTIWLPVDEPFMKCASGCLVLMMDGWEESYGVQHEIKRFQDMNKPVRYIGYVEA